MKILFRVLLLVLMWVGSTSSPTSSLTSRLTATSDRSPSSMCPPGTVYLLPHLYDFTSRISPLLLTMSAPTVASGKFCTKLKPFQTSLRVA